MSARHDAKFFPSRVLLTRSLNSGCCAVVPTAFWNFGVLLGHIQGKTQKAIPTSAAALYWDPSTAQPPHVAACKQCWDGQLPELGAARQYSGIFISGSHYSAYEDLPWIADLAAWLRAFLTEGDHETRIVAVCFGGQVLCSASSGVARRCEPVWYLQCSSYVKHCMAAQVLARALGGVVAANPSTRFVLKGAATERWCCHDVPLW